MADRPEPRVWLLLSYRAGENTQIRALASALDWPVEEKRLVYRRFAWRAHLLCGETLSGVDPRRSDPLEPPWPDLVISAALRNEPVARWIRRRADHPVKLVFLGRVWAALKHFDLLITTPQYRVPEHPRVLHNLGTQQAVTADWLAAAAERWEAQLAGLARPWVAVLVGGSSGPYALDACCAVRLAREASALVAGGGSLLLSTSSRTPATASKALAQHLRVPHRLYHWSAHGTDNPYPGFLALADQLVVTGDSIAMLSEACATGKPVHIFDLATGSQAMGPVAAQLPGRSLWGDWSIERCQAFAYRVLMRLGPRRLSRDIRLVHQALVASGRAVWLGEALLDGSPVPLQDRQRALARVHALPGLLTSSAPPRTWLLLGHKAGDNTQLRALARALGWPCEEKRLHYHPWELLSGRLPGANLLGVDRNASDALVAPWPGLILTAGRRNEPVARWIRRQAGSNVRIVHVGRPWASLDLFDLIVSTPQYALPRLPQIRVNRLPLYDPDPAILEAEGLRWSPRLAELPRPWTAVLVGGASGPYHFDAPEARRLGQSLGRWMAGRGGSLLVTTSARTARLAADMLQQTLPGPRFFHRWDGTENANPYRAFLALADDLVVTGESMSMLAEACATGKPVQVFPLGEGRFAMQPAARQTPSWWWCERRNWRFRALSHRLAMSLAPRRMRRDVRILLDELVSSGRVNWLGEAVAKPSAAGVTIAERCCTAARVRRLMGLPVDGCSAPGSDGDAIVSPSSGGS